MPIPPQLVIANTSVTFGVLVDAVNNLSSTVVNTSAYILVSQNATPQVSTGNVSINGTATITNLVATTLSGNGLSLTYLNASAMGTGTIPIAQLPVANATSNGIVTTAAQSIAGVKTFTNDVVISGNLTISGTATVINTNSLLIGDNILTLNSDLPPATPPTENSGFEVNRGSSANVALIWDEGIDAWTQTRDGSVYGTIPMSSETTNASNLASGTVPNGQLNGTYSNTTANNATYAYGKTEGALNANSALTANASTYLNGKLESGLNVNSATTALTANNATNAFGKTEGALNANSALTANAALYLNGKTEANLNVNSATTALTANASTYLNGKLEAGLNVNSATTALSLNTNSTATIALGSITANTLILNTTATWNNSAVVFTGIYENITDTASNALSLLIDLNVGGSSKFKVDKTGTIYTNGSAIMDPIVAAIALG